MSWVKFDDGFHDHRKTLRVPLAALGLYVLGQSYCSRHATDGHLSATTVQGLCRGVRKRQPHWKKLADELVDAGLWERDGDHYRVHDFLDYNPSAAERRQRAAELRTVRAAAGSRGGQARANSAAARKQNVGLMHATDVLMSDACNQTTNPATQPGEILDLPKQTASKQKTVFKLPSLKETTNKEEVSLVTTRASPEPPRPGRRFEAPLNDWDARVAAVWEECKGAPPSRLSLNDLDALRGRIPLETVTRNLRHYLTTVAPRFHSLRRFAETVGDHDPTRTRSEPGVVTYTPFALQPGRGPA